MDIPIQKDETIAQFVRRLESEANERIALIATIRKMMKPDVPVAVSNGHVSSPERVASPRTKKTTIADSIAAILNESGKPLTQPEIRNALYAKGIATHIKNPLSAINTAMTRKMGTMFERGDGHTWKLIDF